MENERSQDVFEALPEETSNNQDWDEVYNDFDDYPSDLPLDFVEHPNISEEMAGEDAYEDYFRIVSLEDSGRPE